MNFDELLKSLELTDEQTEAIAKGMADNKIYLSKEQDIDTRFAKMKEQRDIARDQAKEANDKVAELTTQAEATATQLAELEDLKTRAEGAEKELTTTKKTQAVRDALTKLGASDLDYAMFKLGGVDTLETGEDGSIKDLDTKLKTLKEAIPTYFTQPEVKSEPAKPEPGKQLDNGFKIIDSSLKQGNSQELDPFEAKLAQYK